VDRGLGSGSKDGLDMSPEFGDTSIWVDEAETITWEQMLAVQKIMNEQEIPDRGRKLPFSDGVMIMDERPLVFRPFSRRSGSPRVSKHKRARRQRHA
jgi:hypothetical protein